MALHYRNPADKLVHMVSQTPKYKIYFNLGMSDNGVLFLFTAISENEIPVYRNGFYFIILLFHIMTY